MKGIAMQLNNVDLDLEIEPIRNELGQIIAGLTVGNALYQNQALLLSFHPGDLKESPTIGVGLSDALLSEDLLRFRHEIRRQFTQDGMDVKSLDYYKIGSLKIDANYVSS